MDLRQFPTELGVELLCSRRNWTDICLPADPAIIAAASSFAALNTCSFKLTFEGVQKGELNPWLHNPHLTALNLFAAAPGCLEGLQHCKNLTYLVHLPRFERC